MVTIREVAKEANVSTSTVSHVINNTRFVSPETRDRVLASMQQLNYRRNRIASSLRSNQTYTLGVLLPNSANPHFAEMLVGIESASFDLNYRIIMGNANDDPVRELAYAEVLLSQQVDGILLISAGDSDETLDLIEEYDVPLIVFEHVAEERNVGVITSDNKMGARLAADYLYDLGHRQIACISGPTHIETSVERKDVFLEQLYDRGVTVPLQFQQPGDYQHAGGYVACQDLLKLPKLPTAIFACNDLMAVGAIRAIYEAGLRVPEDISVLGFDNIPLASYVIPALTTVAQSSQRLGAIAVEKMVEHLQDDESEVLKFQEVLPVSILERASCRPMDG